jgi:hypothetical protein
MLVFEGIKMRLATVFEMTERLDGHLARGRRLDHSRNAERQGASTQE